MDRRCIRGRESGANDRPKNVTRVAGRRIAAAEHRVWRAEPSDSRDSISSLPAWLLRIRNLPRK
ncbi:hypothetical protein KFK09_026769 [Dendrobium nobile]|uniref:Uncharacterized protein n=1 Tax=Dendrobium nobile TaxID=94219 RepID=A0A8T3A7H1_DENNO|nr:hypothetical protein KFK09_026769 [Dendrobium nobile]